MLVIDDFDKDYYDFEDSAVFLTGKKEREARLAFAKRIELLIGEYPNVSELYHKLGLCFYNLSKWEDEDKKIIETSFHRALLIDQNSIFSLLFLTFFYFDIECYQLSLKSYEQLLNNDLKKEIPSWRLTKLVCIKLSCLIYLHAIETDSLSFELDKLLESFANLEEDESDAAQPIELLKALKESVHINNAKVMGQVKLLSHLAK